MRTKRPTLLQASPIPSRMALVSSGQMKTKMEMRTRTKTSQETYETSLIQRHRCELYCTATYEVSNSLSDPAKQTTERFTSGHRDKHRTAYHEGQKRHDLLNVRPQTFSIREEGRPILIFDEHFRDVRPLAMPPYNRRKPGHHPMVPIGIPTDNVPPKNHKQHPQLYSVLSSLLVTARPSRDVTSRSIAARRSGHKSSEKSARLFQQL